jgi:glycosyltransferase involved in cell wall biosynthesis
MNILLANWTWYPSGGDWTYINHLCSLLSANGHTIIPFSMQDERNIQTPYSKYFVHNINYKELNKNKNLRNSYKVITQSLYSREAKNKLEKLLEENIVDIAQLNNIHNYLTPSIIPVLRKRRIPIVWRVLDYKLVCPNTTFLSGERERICESCKNRAFIMCAIKKCKKDSLRASFVASSEAYLYSFLGYYKHVDLFIFQSEFSRNKFIECGFDSNKTAIIKNPLDTKSIVPQYSHKDFILFLGRLERIKGIYTLLRAMKNLPKIQLKVIGTGSEYHNCVEYIYQHQLSNVELLGAKWGGELDSTLAQAAFTIVPSEWYEVSPYSLLQSFAFGKPVIGTDIAGIKDLIDDGVNGLLFKIGDSQNLEDKIRSLYNSKELIVTMGINARTTVDKYHSYNHYYNETISIFQNLLKAKK